MVQNRLSAAILGFFIFIGLFFGLYFTGSLVAESAIKIKEYERTVTVKGLSEKEYLADIVIWPLQFNLASNSLTDLYNSIDNTSSNIKEYLISNGIESNEITLSSPSISDKSAQQYGGSEIAQFRYTAYQTVTVYTDKVEKVRELQSSIINLGKKGIVLTGDSYDSQTEYIFSRLNEVKPVMIEEATIKAREVALKFAEDSESKLGKIKSATQGQFSIDSRDKNNPHIKKVRVVSTVEYYLSD
ncbi:MAG: SIMPL domain-containing protein [Spirochaetales bacterium]|nr:SIMPL domain-containing protein [Spirochaetales bacterium]